MAYYSRFLSVLFVIVLAGCSESADQGKTKQADNSDDEFIMSSVSEKLPADKQAFFNQRMPDVLGACPGLVNHLHELEFVDVALGDYRPSIVWQKRAGGNNCYFEYDAKQDAVMVAKTDCQNLCAGKDNAAGGAEFLTVLITR